MAINDYASEGFPTGAGTLGGIGSILSGLVQGVTPESYGTGGSTLGMGTNTLQQSIDTLTNAVNRLSTLVGSLNMGGGSRQAAGGAQTGGPSGPPRNFPPVINPFRSPPAAGGIGGGGSGGAGNITPPNTFGSSGSGNAGYGIGAGLGAMISSFVGYGRQQLPAQLAMNAYVAQTRLGLPTGTGFPRAQTGALMQATGIGNTNLNALAINPMDAVAMAQALQYAGGAPYYMTTPIGRGAYGATAAFGISNPLLSGASAAGLAQQLYSPSLSLRALSLGYPSQPRVLGGGANNSATFAQAMFRAWTGGRSNVNPATLFASLAQGGRANLNLQALGLNPTQMAPFLETYNQLFRQGMNPNQAQQLLNAAARNAPGAQQRLQNLGVSTTDIQKIKNAQSALTGRDAAVANSFNSALSAATTGLERFNKALTTIFQKTPLGSMIGYGGGLGSVFGGANFNSLLGIGGAFALGRGAVGAATGGMSSGGLAGALGGGGFLSALGGLAAGGGILGGAVLGARNTLYSRGSSVHTGNPISNLLHGIADFFTGHLFTRMTQNTGGGAGGPGFAVSSQQRTSGGQRSLGGGIGGAALTAVSAAEKEVGLPYIWGGETPGVGFDCSGLVQWAYSQAGVRIPRTSQQQWAALKKRAVPTNQAQEGDLVFQAGSDGTATAPGHVAMLISRSQIVEAPFTGANVRNRAYNPKEWLYAARVSGALGSPIGGSSSNSSSPQGNAGLSMSPGIGGNYGSTEEVDAISAALMGGGFGASSFGAAGSGSGTGGSGASTGGGASISGLRGNKKIMNMAAARYGWGTGAEWSALNTLEMHEAGYNNLAQNPTSTAYGMGQFLDTTWATVGGHKTSDPALQAAYMMKYIKQRYRDPIAAWAQYYQHPGGIGYYAAGTGRGVNTGVSVVGERGPELMFGGTGAKLLDNAQSMRLLKAISAQPQQAPWSALNELTATQQSTGQQVATGATVNLHFHDGAIAIRVDGSTHTASSSGRMIAKHIVKSLEDERLYTAISRGNKNG